MQLISGRVKTKFYQEHVIPEGSLYASMRDEWSKRTANMDPSLFTFSLYVSIPNQSITGILMDVDVFANNVVTKVLKPSVSAWIWEGGQTTLVWFATNFLPVSVMVRHTRSRFPLAK
jgi:hypothetical protein